MATATPPSTLLTAEEFAKREDPGYLEELVRGRIVRMTPAGARHGQICHKVARILGNFTEAHDLGHVLNNDSGIVTRRDPDSVRGADVAYYSYARLAKESTYRTFPTSSSRSAPRATDGPTFSPRWPNTSKRASALSAFSTTIRAPCRSTTPTARREPSARPISSSFPCLPGFRGGPGLLIDRVPLT